MKKTLLVLALITFSLYNGIAQAGQDDDISSLLDSLSAPTDDYAYAFFKTTRIVTGHSIEQMKAGQLEFRISHRFGKLNSGAGQLWGLDQSTILFSLEYGITDWLETGIMRTPNEKILNGFAKVKLLRQVFGGFPVSISYFGSAGVSTIDWANPDRENYFSSRLHFAHQILIAKKFSEDFSLQLTPTLVHRNLVPNALDENDLFAVGIGGRYKLTNRISVNAEYFHAFQPTYAGAPDLFDPMSIGFDIETGGHVFQIMLSNSVGMIEKHYIAENTGDASKGDMHLGFNISRTFTLIGE
ncbi:MAG: DUF5777 family beta-barrel protein [Chloroflexota bacterium]